MCDSLKSPLHPWRLDTNDRYKDAMKIIMDLSTASLVLPIFFLRDILRIPTNESLSQVLNYKIYLSWGCLALALLFGFIFYYASAKWVRLAWGKNVAFFRKRTNNEVVEKVLDISFPGAVISFLLGIGLTLWFVVSFRPIP